MTAVQGESRIDYLSQPKKLPDAYFDNRRSVYWVDKEPIQSNGKTEIVVTPRVDALSQPKRGNMVNPDHRDGPIWDVSDGAKSVEATPRTCELAKSKEFLEKYGIGKNPFMIVSDEAKSGSASTVVENLATPKTRKSAEGIIDLGEFPDPLVQVSEATANAKATVRVEELAGDKKLHKSYVSERSVIWPVSENARSATATTRILQLARHKTSLGDTEEYDPYVVTVAARRAKAAPRVQELAEPLPRKTRSKLK